MSGQVRFDALRSCLVTGLLLLLLVATVRGAKPPAIDQISTLACRPGEATELVLEGDGMHLASGLWTSFPATVTRAEISPEHVEANRAVFHVDIPASTEVQIGAIRARTDQGVSNLRLIAIDDLATAPVTAGTDRRDAAVTVVPPIACEGAIEKTQTHWFQFSGQHGQRVAIEVFAARLGSALDPLVELTDATGRSLAESDDVPGLGGDARLVCHLPADGTYFVGLRDVEYRGGQQYFYRMRMGNFPEIVGLFPLGVQQGKSTTLQVLYGSSGRHTAEVVGREAGQLAAFGFTTDQHDASAFYAVAVGDDEELIEEEPNDSAETANRLPANCAINGQLVGRDDRDWYEISLAEGHDLHIAAAHSTLGVPTRLFLRLYDQESELLTQVAQTGVNPAELHHRADKAGIVRLQVEELHRRSAAGQAYRLEITRGKRQIELTVDNDHFNVPEAGVFVVKVTAKRRGYDGPIQLAVDGIAGVQLSDNVIAEKENETVLKVQMPDSIAAGSLQWFRIVGTKSGEDTDGVATDRELATALNNLARSFHLAVHPPLAWRQLLPVGVGPPFPDFFQLATSPSRLWIPQGQQRLDMRVTAKRLQEFAGQIDLRVANHPKALEAKVSPIEKDAESTVVRLQGLGDLPVGIHTFDLRGLGTYENQPGGVTLSQISLRVGSPFTVKVDPIEPLSVGRQRTVRLQIQRFTADQEMFHVSARNLPAGVQLGQPDSQEGDQEVIEIPLIAEESAAASVSDVIFTVTTKIKPPQLMSEESDSITSYLSEQELSAQGVLREAESFDRGNVTIIGVEDEDSVAFISDPGSQENFAEYDIELPEAGSYQVELRYAAEQSRPGQLLVNSQVVKEGAIAEVTGGWSADAQRWHVEGTFEFAAGKNVLRLQSAPLMSHIDKLLVIKPMSQQVARATFDSWIDADGDATAESRDGDLISVFASDNRTTGTARRGIIEFDLQGLTGAELLDAYLELGVDGRDRQLATGPVFSVARLLPAGTDAGALTGSSYEQLREQGFLLEQLGRFEIAEGESVAAGAYERSAGATDRDLAELKRRLTTGESRLVFGLEALEDGSGTSRDWGANDEAPRGTQGGPLPPHLVLVWRDDDSKSDAANEITVESDSVVVEVASADE